MFDAPLVDRIGWTLVHSVWQIILVAYLVACCNRFLFRTSANGRYAAGCFALLAMVLAPLATFWIAAPPSRAVAGLASVELARPIATEPEANAEPFDAGDSPEVALLAEEQSANGLEEAGRDSNLDGLTDTGELADTESAAAATWQSATSARATARRAAVGRFAGWRAGFADRLQAAMSSIVMVWLVGVLMLSVRPVLGWYTVGRLRRVGCSDVQDNVGSIVRRLCARMGISRTVEVSESALLDVPAVVGSLRPLLLLPATAITGLTPSQLEAVIAHELAHVRRHDYIVNFLQTLVETLLFYHPAVWWVSHLVRQERENCCDDIAMAVCNDRATYANALVVLDELRSCVPPAALAANGGSLLQRIRRIAEQDSAPARGLWPTGILLLMLVVTCGGLWWNGVATTTAAGEQIRFAVSETPPTQQPPAPPARGTLRGRFVFDGDPPKRRALPLQQHRNGQERVESGARPDQQGVEGTKLLDESLIVAEDGGVANVIVWVRNTDIPAPVHTDKRLPHIEPARINIRHSRFEPHVLVMQTKQELVVRNDMTEANAFKAEMFVNPPLDILLRPGREREIAFPRAEPLPVSLVNDLHHWYRGRLLVRDNPYFSVTGEDGSFEIPNLPTGNWEFQFWHEKVGYLNRDDWPSGRLRIDIKPGVLDLDTIKLTASDFQLDKLDAKAANAHAKQAETPQTEKPQTAAPKEAAPAGFEGSLTGRFVFDGVPPAQRALQINRDADVLAGRPLFDESFVVGKDRGVANIFVFVRDANIPVLPSREPLPPVTLTIKDLHYQPHALAVRTGQKLQVANEDSVASAPHLRLMMNPPKHFVLHKGGRQDLSFERSERMPVLVSAAIHPWLKGWLLVRDNPYFDITDERGTFTITNMPPGEWEFQFWHEKAGYLKRESWPKGRLTLKIGKGATDLGTVKLTHQDFGIEQPQPDNPPPPTGELQGRHPVWLAALAGDKDKLLKLLQDQPEMVDWRNETGFAPLHWAAMRETVDAAKLLLDVGADVAVKQGKYAGTPLQYAAGRGTVEICQLLLSHDAPVDAVDSIGRTPLLWAAMGGHTDVASLLLDHGADINAQTTAANPSVPSGTGSTPLHIAAKKGHDGLVRLLLDRGASTTIPNQAGLVALHGSEEFSALSDWFRDAPYPEIGFPQSYEIDRSYVRIASHPPAHRELDVSAPDSAVLKRLGQWAMQDFYEIKPPDREKRQAVWAKARKRLQDILSKQQLQRLKELVIQQRRAEVFINPTHLPELELSDEQLAEIRSRWQEHLALVKARKSQVQAGRTADAAGASAGRNSYRRFWHEVHEILTEQQRATFRELRGRTH